MGKKIIPVVVAVVVIIIAAVAILFFYNRGVNEENLSLEGENQSTPVEEGESEDNAGEETGDNEDGSPAEDVSDSDGENSGSEFTQEDALALLQETFGAEDADTGFPFSYQYVEVSEVDGVSYYNFRMSWLVENDHYSYLGNMFVALDGSVVYSGIDDGNGGWVLEYDE